MCCPCAGQGPPARLRRALRPFPWGDNVHDLPVEQARTREFDCILFQDDHQWEKDQYEFLTPAQRALPRIYLEHDPPRAPSHRRHPHLVDDPACCWSTSRPSTR
jgi:hypothetical protein